ncbi:MAG TPA: amidohydrolase family protein [Allosphingosinicella sp.]|nr:amidohydrolase family protein [Allosphingosinicella sp.]
MRLLLLLLLAALASPAEARPRPPIIDMHMHAMAADGQGPPPARLCSPRPTFDAWDQRRPYLDQFVAMLGRCRNPLVSPMTDDALMRRSIEIMDRLNVIGVVSGTPEHVDAWRQSRPERFIPALHFALQPDETIERVRQLHAEGRMQVFGEVVTQYRGIAPDDPRLEPFWAMAEELDIPVNLHIGTGPPGVIYLDSPDYRARLHSALTVEPVLVRHPRLRLYIAHAGYPMIDDLLAMLYAHPQLHVDVGVIVFTQPRPAFYRYLQRIVEAGFESRIMFGSDQMVWPEAIERGVRTIEDAPFLTRRQKRAILYDNAARFLRLTPEQIAAHHALGR